MRGDPLAPSSATNLDLSLAQPRPLRVALLGYGCVGSAVAALIGERDPRLRVVRALVRDVTKPRPSPPASGLLTTNFVDIASDPEIDVVIEAIGGVDPAKRYIEELIASGKHVVSANKQVLGRHLHELSRLAQRNSVSLRFEAAVAGAIPVVRTITELLPRDSVRRIAGILNGTTNYLLTRVERGDTFQEALADAQRLGYAEEDATDDLSGRDSAAKIAILAALAFSAKVRIDEVRTEGIEHLCEADVRDATRMGRRLRLIAEATLADGAIRTRVAPMAVPEDDSLARVQGAFNEVVIEGRGFRSLTLRGPGAGGVETATAVLSDVAAIAREAAARGVV